MSIDPTATTDIVVIGYGPTGAVLANLLGLRGWTVEVFEREREPLRAPRAVHFDAEVMRVFQQAGVAGQLDAAVVPVKGMHFLNADGTTIFRFDAIAGDGPLGWPQGFMFHQPDLEHVLRTNAARHASVTVHLGHEVQAVDHTGDAGHAVVSVNGPAGPRTVRARYVVGCCGARSLTRAAIGGELTDFGFTQDWLVLDVLLRRAVDLPVVTVQYCDPARPRQAARRDDPARHCHAAAGVRFSNEASAGFRVTPSASPSLVLISPPISVAPALANCSAVARRCQTIRR